MIKLIAMIKRKAGLSRQEFIDYYEGTHVPFVTRASGAFFIDYKRNYICEELTGSGSDDFDVVTEVWIKDRAALDGLLAMMTESPWARELAIDEDRFVDRASMRMFVTEEYRPARDE